jgi:hypothetical protein
VRKGKPEHRHASNDGCETLERRAPSRSIAEVERVDVAKQLDERVAVFFLL